MEKKEPKTIISRIFQFLFVSIVTILAWFNVASSIMFVCAVILIALAGKLESLVEFSFGPLKAKIERNLTQSEELLEKLKAFSAIQARAAIAASVNTGRFASSDDWIFQSVKRVEEGLRSLGIGDSEISEARSEFVSLTIKDTGSAAIGHGHLPMQLPEEARSEWRLVSRSDPDMIESYLQKWEQLTPERALRIADMRWMIENNDVQDSEQYMRAHTPVKWPGQP